jgi:sulfate permease, SulP family
MWQRIFPGLLWFRDYQKSTLRGDFFSGITIGIMLIPQGMGYALVAGLPAEVGLYAAIFPPILYALLGTSNKISIGPVALDSILILTGLSVIAEPGSPHYVELAIGLTLMVGLIQTALGLLRFGVIANFLSYPVVIGYTSAAAVIIIGSQLANVAGVNLNGTTIFEKVYQLCMSVTSWNVVTLAISACCFLFLRFTTGYSSKFPAALFALVVGMSLSGIYGFAQYGVDVIDTVPAGLPALAFPELSLNHYIELLPTAFAVALMGYVGTISICKSQDNPSDKIQTRPNQELLAIGLANCVGAVFRAFPVSASFSRSAAFRSAGALTQFSAVVSSVLIAAAVLFLTPLFTAYPLPKAVLSVIIIVSVAGLFKYHEMKAIFSQEKREFYILMATFLTTLFLGVEKGLMAGVFLSMAMVIFNSAQPHIAKLGLIESEGLYRNVDRFETARERDDILIFRFDAPLYFANMDQFKETLFEWMRERDRGVLKAIIFDGESVNSVDASALRMLSQLVESLQAQDIRFCMTNLIGPVRDSIKQSDMGRSFAQEHTFSTVHDAVYCFDSGVHRNVDIALQTNT